MLNWSTAIAGIALIAAIVSPVITAVFNNKYQLKLKDREIMTTRKLDVIERYLKAASETYHRPGIHNEYANYSAVILLYTPIELQEKIIQLNEMLSRGQKTDEVARLLHEVAAALRSENKVT